VRPFAESASIARVCARARSRNYRCNYGNHFVAALSEIRRRRRGGATTKLGTKLLFPDERDTRRLPTPIPLSPSVRGLHCAGSPFGGPTKTLKLLRQPPITVSLFQIAPATVVRPGQFLIITRARLECAMDRLERFDDAAARAR